MINFENATIDYNLEHGFAFAFDSDGKGFFQVCLEQRKDGNGFKKSIKSKDCGWNEGICGDVNAVATNSDLKEFLILARKHGLKII